MEIVIKIDDDLYREIENHDIPLHHVDILCESVLNGTPLPKGHGNLIDADEFNKYLISRDSSFRSMLSDIPTIIEANGGEEDEENS